MPLERAPEQPRVRSPSKQRTTVDNANEDEPPRASRVSVTWSMPAIAGVPPCARGGHSAVLADTHVLVFGGHYFGGAGAFAYLNDLHRLDLTTSTWYEIVFRAQDAAVRPSPRYNHSALLLNNGTRMFVFGGRGETTLPHQAPQTQQPPSHVLRDMFFFDLLAMEWFQVQWTTVSPPARFGHTCASVDDVRMIVFGGWDGKTSRNDLWLFDSHAFTWHQPRCAGKAPAPRQNHSMQAVSATTLLVYGGYSVLPDAGTLPVYNKDVYLFDVESLAWSRPRLVGEYPLGTFGHGLCVTSTSDLAFVLGGWSGTERSPLFMGDKHVRELATMAAREERLASGHESKRSKHAQTKQLRTGAAYAHVLDLQSMTWYKPTAYGVAVANRYGHSCTLVGPHVFLFGGWDGNRALNQVVVGEFTTE